MEDALTLPYNDHSDIDNVYHDGGESLDVNGVTSLNGNCDRIKDLIPLEIIVMLSLLKVLIILASQKRYRSYSIR